MPWLLALVGAMVCGVAEESITVPAVAGLVFAGAVFLGSLAVIGMTYAMFTYLLAGSRADRRRNRRER